MPVLVPTYGHGTKGKEALSIALKMNDLISCDRNSPLKDPQKHIPTGQMLSRQVCLDHLPDLPTTGLTGAARFHDAQVYNSEQLVLAFIQSAAERGATVANYTRIVNFRTQHGRVVGAIAQDQLTASPEQNRFDIQATTIVNASGPWIHSLINAAQGKAAKPTQSNTGLAKAMNLVVRPLLGAQQKHAVGITGRAPGSRLFFVAPWRGKSMIGTWYGPDREGVKPPAATSNEITSFLAEVNQAYPTFNLTPDDVQWVHSGLLPSDGLCTKTGEPKLTKHFQLQDHRRDGYKGLLSVSAVKYTTAGDVARRAVNWVFQNRQQMPETSHSHQEPLHGGHIEQFQSFLANVLSTYKGQASPQALTRLVYNYGSACSDILQPLESTSAESTSEQDRNLLAAEIRYNLKHTMPQTLSDIIFRRTELGAVGHPGDDTLHLCAQITGDALGWNFEKRQRELEAVQQRFQGLYQPLKDEIQHSPTEPTRAPCPI
jgi:glycerol-3-phosphate dehydrogenase